MHSPGNAHTARPLWHFSLFSSRGYSVTAPQNHFTPSCLPSGFYVSSSQVCSVLHLPWHSQSAEIARPWRGQAGHRPLTPPVTASMPNVCAWDTVTRYLTSHHKSSLKRTKTSCRAEILGRLLPVIIYKIQMSSLRCFYQPPTPNTPTSGSPRLHPVQKLRWI